MCVCVCVCVRERESERDKESERERARARARERERERERESERETEPARLSVGKSAGCAPLVQCHLHRAEAKWKDILDGGVYIPDGIRPARAPCQRGLRR